ncbi:MAG: glycoside hydrolase family 9 protein [Balneola sp.]|nr:glycoside hydrolase family 9 protein [Balneola sp.]MBO6650949.1 glycoside hydrolase family 9 protein [Balneola sp.]MBO6711891.1 glycoside hydrolase family 9 protein [Balneola sp.]MBO6800086.1 glycoside hydrolase family 9 protein [Balneola sp.]MBO6871533.1 glycoside hydrolase family 9 protein [Balneola sp.]
MSTIKLLVSTIVLLVIACSGKKINDFPAQKSPVKVNIEGYLPSGLKSAIVTKSLSGVEFFEIVNTENNEIVYTGQIPEIEPADAVFGEPAYKLDFSNVSGSGTYKVLIPKIRLSSVEFQISNDVYNRAFQTSLESFYYQRCGTKIDNGTSWSHSACHLDDASFFDTNKEKDVSGGWHDAGDYGKYSVNTSVSLAFILYLYDHQKYKFKDGQLNIPENGNSVPDLLDESKWALKWLLKMQSENGGVYHKVQKKKWTGEYLPQDDPDARYIYEVSSTATAGFAAVSALASRIFKEFNPKFADSLKTASERAWDFLEKKPNIFPENGFKNPEGVKGGEYGDSNDSDERLWASVELYRLTKNEKYHTYFLDNYKKLHGPTPPPLSWKNVKEFAYFSYLNIENAYKDNEATNFITEKYKRYGAELLRRSENNNYRIVLDKDEFYWGSNSVLLGYCFSLIQIYEITQDESFKNLALEQLNYLLGRNPFGFAYLTGLGKNSIRQPYHQFSNELNSFLPVPGMVVGGPNSKNKLNGISLSEYPGKAFEDNHKNYMVNEVAINYTAPFVFVSGYFSFKAIKNNN